MRDIERATQSVRVGERERERKREKKKKRKGVSLQSCAFFIILDSMSYL